ncbi:MAG: hypothetical protein ABR511_01695 [Acidimicrobiales bacterium]
MFDADVVLNRLAATQCGLVTHEQALAAGVSGDQCARRRAAGLLIGVHDSVYRMAAVPPSPHQDVLAACLAAGPAGVASHRSAAALLGLRGVAWGRPEITVPGTGRPRLAGVTVHRSPLAPVDVGRCGPIAVTRPARTLLDLAAVEPRLAEGAVSDALVRRLTTVPTLEALLERVGGRGRRGTALLRRLVAAHQAGRAPTESPLEDALIRLLLRHRLPQPVRQHPVRFADGTSVRLDLAYPGARLAVEADGRTWHSGIADFRRDRARSNRLTAAGWTILRYGWADLGRGPEVAREIRRMLSPSLAG